MAKKQTSKDVMLAHSKAKVEYYQKYLACYLSIMSVAKKIDEVNVFDVFCGRGVYADGELGSPIRSVQTAREVRRNHPSNKFFNFYFNDVEEAYVRRVKSYIDENIPDNKDFCHITYLNAPAELLFEKIGRFLANTSFSTKNFLFVDPYGYKDINRHTIQRLMCNQNTEMLLFLPISFMHRFTHYAFNVDANNGALRLREFIEQFFPADHKVRSEEPMDVKEYIEALVDAFSFGGRYYTTSYFIERDSRNYFALFAICNNLLGLEKAVETKWKLDEQDGKGFHLPDADTEPDLFSELFMEENRQEHYEELKALLISFLMGRKGGRSNGEMYEFVLRHGYLPKHANAVLRQLQDNNLINVKLFGTGKEARKHSFYINYNDSKDAAFPKAIISLRNENNKN